MPFPKPGKDILYICPCHYRLAHRNVLIYLNSRLAAQSSFCQKALNFAHGRARGWHITLNSNCQTMRKIFFLIICVNMALFHLSAQEQKTSFKEKVIAIQSSGCRLEGSLLVPNAHAGIQKMVIIIAGSGPTDRNGNNPLGINASSYRMLAEALADKQICTFRYDKRGIGKSIPEDFRENTLRFDDYVDDAVKIYDYLRDSLGYKNIYIIGHSEGSLIGMLASQKRSVSGFVSLSGAGRPIDVIIDEQISKQPVFVKNQVDSIFSFLRKGKTFDSVPPYLNSLFRPSVQPYMISWLKYTPALEIAKVHCAVLIMQGACDIQVNATDAENLHQASTSSVLSIIPSMTHVLKNAGENCKDENQKTYTDATLPLNTQMIKELDAFIKQK